MEDVPTVKLVVMRLKDMHRVHPGQITARCSMCHKKVGVYPSGQKVMKEYPGEVELVCSVCNGPVSPFAPLAPGAEIEPFESVRNKEKDN